MLVFHLNPNWLPGGFVGVDIFFVISGYLITQVLLRDIELHKSVRLATFYGRRVKRLMPAATVVLVATALLYPWLPSTSWISHAEQILASTFYVQNWWLGFEAVDYLAAERPPGPLQHFWSLAVEEQYYLVWPLLLSGLAALSGAIAKRCVVFFGATVVFLVSLAHSVVFSALDPAMAYFSTTTRMWELALGGLLASGSIRTLRRGEGSSWLMALGLLLIAASFVAIDRQTIFPGFMALLPTIGAAFVILAGSSTTAWSGHRLLQTAPFQYLGDISYSLYLWHWPIIIFYPQVTGREIGALDTVLILATSILLADASKRFIEDPLRQRDLFGFGRWWPLALAVFCLAAGALGAMHVTKGQAALRATNGGLTFRPSPADARDDRPATAKMGCHARQRDVEPSTCSFGPSDSDTHIALVGDSHALQWAPAFREIAEANGWRFTVLTKSACAFADVTVRVGSPPRPYKECLDWSEQALGVLGRLKPSHVVIGQSITQRVFDLEPAKDSAEILAQSYARTWQRVEELGARVIVMKDTPRLRTDVPQCLSSPGKRVSDCASRRRDVLDRPMHPDPVLLAARLAVSTSVLDFSDKICASTICPAVIDDILVWRDTHHLTATFVSHLNGEVATQLSAIMGVEIVGRTQGERAPLVVEQDVTDARRDRPATHRDSCFYNHRPVTPPVCSYENNGEGRPIHIALVGDARAAQWLPALRNITEPRAIKISTIVNESCPLGELVIGDRDCTVWTDAAMSLLSTLAPDLVLISQSRGHRVSGVARGRPNAEALADALSSTLVDLGSGSTKVILIADTPRMPFDPVDCLKTEPAQLCMAKRDAALPSDDRPDPIHLVDQPEVQVIDLVDRLCPPQANGFCPAVINDTVVWRTRYLVTATFARSVAEEFRIEITSR